MSRLSKVALVFLISLIGVKASALPDMPQPKPADAVIHSYWSPAAKRIVGIEFVAASADMAITCRNLSLGGHEWSLPTQSCGETVAIQLGIFAAAQGTAYLLHRTGHHKLEHLPRLYMIGANTYGFVYSIH
jgi:hypothetical protein